MFGLMPGGYANRRLLQRQSYLGVGRGVVVTHAIAQRGRA